MQWNIVTSAANSASTNRPFGQINGSAEESATAYKARGSAKAPSSHHRAQQFGQNNIASDWVVDIWVGEAHHLWHEGSTCFVACYWANPCWCILGYHHCCRYCDSDWLPHHWIVSYLVYIFINRVVNLINYLIMLFLATLLNLAF